MSGLEPVLMKAGQAVVAPAIKRWLADRRRREEAALPLSELLNRRFTDSFARRKVEREIQAMADAAAQRLLSLEQMGEMPANERRAALDAAVTAFTEVANTDEALFEADARLDLLAVRIKSEAADVPIRAGLSEAGRRLFERTVDECCTLYTQTVTHLPSFVPRATAELLSRTAGLGDQLSEVLARLPQHTLDAPTGIGDDAGFRRRYLAQVVGTLDEAELFGVDVRYYRPRTTLTVAYLSLAVATDDSTTAEADGERRQRSIGGVLVRTAEAGGAAPDVSSLRVEQALARSNRTVLRGEAGSGKTTILRWLAVNAARGAFRADLAGWNGHVPFLVVLRRYAKNALPTPDELVAATVEVVAGQQPASWAHRQLASGKALLLVDGVDEVPAPRRRAIRDWLRQMTTAYPEVQVVVTSRPAAAAAGWASAEGFGSIMLERMTPTDVRVFINHWHRAIALADDLPLPLHALPRYENALLGRLDANPHLQAVATSPLLCAMLCALNLDRRTHLPMDRMSLYSAMVDLLLERRDVERDILTHDVAISGRDRLQLLQYLAGKMSINNETETGRHIAVLRLEEKLAAMPQVTAEPQDILDQLLQRSGLLRQPVIDRIDFVHRTFQEYLTAREAADRADVGMLVEKAHRESWRDIVVMAVGHANARMRSDLVELILDRADAESRHGRTLRLLAATCLETAPALAPNLLVRVQRSIELLVPPRNLHEARSLAGVGEPLLRHLPPNTAALSSASAVATVRSAALINGPKAIATLARYATDTRAPVQREIARVWEYFDPDEYAQSVLSDASLEDGHIEVTHPPLLRSVRWLRRLQDLTVRLNELADLADLAGVPHLRTLRLMRGTTSNLAALEQHRELQELRVMNVAAASEPDQLAQLSSLTMLFFFHHPDIANLNFLHTHTELKRLGLGSVKSIVDFTALDHLSELTFLSMVDARLTDYSSLSVFSRLLGLALINAAEPAHGLASVMNLTPELDWLRLTDCTWVRDVAPIATLTNLETLDLSRTPVSDLAPLAELQRLTDVTLNECPNLEGLAALAELPHLRHLDLRGNTHEFDLDPLARARKLTIYLHPGQPVTGGLRRRQNVRVKVLPAYQNPKFR